MQKQHDFFLTGETARTAGREWLGPALQQSRRRTLGLFAAYEKALGHGNPVVPLCAELNPPLWELGHIGWFQEWWIPRNQQREQGVACDPDYNRAPSRLTGADALYDSSRVPHDSRWSLPLPDANRIRHYLQGVLDDTLAQLAVCGDNDASLYFFRLVLLHEDMHAEAAVYMAQALGISLPAELAFPRGVPTKSMPHAAELILAAGEWQLGAAPHGHGFAFDNELGLQLEALAGFEIDASPVSWTRYLPFVEAGGYEQRQWWTADGWAWRERLELKAPRYLESRLGQWQHSSFESSQPLEASAAAVHLSAHEAEAWCRWAGRRLPTEAEWECAAFLRPEFALGEVWEWTGSPFAPFPGFAPHPYRDYSAPWFGSRRVLRGGSEATSPHIIHAKYRNFFTPERSDIFAGFRSCRVE